jgi:predicted component of type VI protein secretion system
MAITPRKVWEVVITTDRSHYERNGPIDTPFPSDAPPRVVELEADEVVIGRCRDGGRVPTIDLALPPQDPAISHEHAVLVRQDDDAYAISDLGSTNGTRVNDEIDPIKGHVFHRLEHGDRVYLGAWTMLVVRMRESPDALSSAQHFPVEGESV